MVPEALVGRLRVDLRHRSLGFGVGRVGRLPGGHRHGSERPVRTCSMRYGSRNCWRRNRCRSSLQAWLRCRHGCRRVLPAGRSRHGGRCCVGQIHSCGRFEERLEHRREVHHNGCTRCGRRSSSCCIWGNPSRRPLVGRRALALVSGIGHGHDRSRGHGRSPCGRHVVWRERRRAVLRTGCTRFGRRSLSCCTWGNPNLHLRGFLVRGRWIGTGRDLLVGHLDRGHGRFGTALRVEHGC